MRSAASVHVDGSVPDNGANVGLNLGINRAGDMSGTISEHGANVNVISTSGKVRRSRCRELLQSAERVMLRDHPLMPIYFYVNKHLVKPEVEGWYDNVMNVVYSKDLSLRTTR